VQRPFYPEGKSSCHIYLLHPPGGLVGGDTLECTLSLASGAHGLVTTPSAGKAYRVANGHEQRQHSSLHVADDAALEWFPQECIAFNGARARISTHIHFGANATVLGWDMLCLGRPASNERFTQGQVRQHLELYCEGKPLLIERAHFDGDSPIMDARWGLQGQPVLGTLYCYCPNADKREDALKQVRSALEILQKPGDTRPRHAATLVNQLLLVRYLGASTEQCREMFIALWKILRPLLLERSACVPRIWNT
jgi:urease accessory protein